MKKRLRRKFRTGEFTDYEFVVQFKIAQPGGETAVGAMLGAFLDQVEAQGLAGGGGCSSEGDFSFFVSSRRERGAVTEAHREVLSAWLAGNPEVAGFTVGPLQNVLG